jgi:hypothetical protein
MKRLDQVRSRSRKSRPDRGLITVAVLVCLVVITMIGVGLLRVVGAQRTTIHNDEHALQSEWLAESGLERAAGRLAAEAGYPGETWSIPADVLGGASAGVVSIRIGPLPDDPDRRLVTVQADYPIDPDLRVRTSKQRALHVGRTRPDPADSR